MQRELDGSRAPQRVNVVSEIFVPEVSEERAGMRTMYAARIDRARRSAHHQLYHLWSRAPAPYDKDAWVALHSSLLALGVDSGTPQYVIESREDYQERLTRFREATTRLRSIRVRVSLFALVTTIVVELFLQLTTSSGSSWLLVIILVWLCTPILALLHRSALLEFRFQLALFCEHCGARLNGGCPAVDTVIARTGECPACHRVVFERLGTASR